MWASIAPIPPLLSSLRPVFGLSFRRSTINLNQMHFSFPCPALGKYFKNVLRHQRTQIIFLQMPCNMSFFVRIIAIKTDTKQICFNMVSGKFQLPTPVSAKYIRQVAFLPILLPTSPQSAADGFPSSRLIAGGVW